MQKQKEAKEKKKDMIKWLAFSEKKVFDKLKSNRQGLSEAESIKRLEKYGYNELKEKKRVTLFKILSRQLTNFIVWVLFAAAIVCLFIAEMLNFYVILFIIVFVITLGFIQEYKAERAMEALKRIIEPITTVMREGRIERMAVKEIVPGDILLLETGDRIPADGKIFEIISLKVDESVLTGESISIRKTKGDLIFAGTTIVYGKCKAVAIATSMQTKLGKIAEMIQEAEEKTPLQIKITSLTKTLAFIALITCSLVFILGVFKGALLTGILIIALALAVASVPEGLPLTLTLTLSLGMHRMAKHNAIIRKMLAVETLGSTTVICSDKTGTLTKNEMTVEKIFVNEKIIDVSGVGYKPEGVFFYDGKEIDPKSDKVLLLILKASALCSNAILEEKKGKWEIIGDPTEAALVVAAAKAELWKDDLETKYQRTGELIFTSERKLMTTIHKKGKEKIAFVKGAPEIVLQKCRYVQKNGKVIKLTEKEIKSILRTNKDFASSALRVISIAYKKVSELLTQENVEKDLIFLGLIAMIDPPRPEVKEAIDTCKKAGIKVVMITGDNPETAKAIAKKIGLFSNYKLNKSNLKNAKFRKIVEDGVIIGKELDELSDNEFEKIVEDIAIYARNMPEHKLRIIKALKKKGHIVAMTGDGVNDAPALKKADIGIAMGIKGTDVTREASDMVLQDDNFATIVEAVKNGRTIYENIEKFTCYLISRNFTEVILILLGIMILGFEFLPLLALQILFINSFDEIMPSVALGFDPAKKDVMFRPPKNPKEKILKKRNLVLVSSIAVFIAAIAFLVFILSNPLVNIEKARTMVFATIIGTILFVPFAFRSLKESVFKIGFLRNKLLIGAVVCVALLTLAIMYIPFFQGIFALTTLSLKDWGLPLSAALITFIFVEFMKTILK